MREQKAAASERAQWMQEEVNQTKLKALRKIKEQEATLKAQERELEERGTQLRSQLRAALSDKTAAHEAAAAQAQQAQQAQAQQAQAQQRRHAGP